MGRAIRWLFALHLAGFVIASVCGLGDMCTEREREREKERVLSCLLAELCHPGNSNNNHVSHNVLLHWIIQAARV